MQISIGPKTADMITYDLAWLFCACLFHEGYSDWRIPTRGENIASRLGGWHQDDGEIHAGNDQRWEICPVRDNK